MFHSVPSLFLIVSARLASKWFYNLFWSSLTRISFSDEAGSSVSRCLTNCSLSSLREVEVWNCPILPSLNVILSQAVCLSKLVLVTGSSASRKRGPSLNFLSSLHYLVALHIDCLSFSRAPNPSLDLITNLTSLTSLTFTGYPPINNAGFAQICSLTKLRTLSIDLPSARILDDGLVALSYLSKLSSLSFGPSNARLITDVGITEICKATTLTNLNISNCLISDYGLTHLAQTLTYLTHLSIRECPYLSSIKSISSLTKLTHLDISKYSMIGDDTMCLLSPLSSLVMLDLSQTQVSDVGVKSLITSLPSLESLNLAGCYRVGHANDLPIKECVLPRYPSKRFDGPTRSRLFRWKFTGKEKAILNGKLVNLPRTRRRSSGS